MFYFPKIHINRYKRNLKSERREGRGKKSDWEVNGRRAWTRIEWQMHSRARLPGRSVGRATPSDDSHQWRLRAGDRFCGGMPWRVGRSPLTFPQRSVRKCSDLRLSRTCLSFDLPPPLKPLRGAMPMTSKKTEQRSRCRWHPRRAAFRSRKGRRSPRPAAYHHHDPGRAVRVWSGGLLHLAYV